MSMDTVLHEALSLPTQERSEVAAELLASLDDPPQDNADSVGAAWAKELEHRARLAHSGADAGEPWTVVRERVRAKLAR